MRFHACQCEPVRAASIQGVTHHTCHDHPCLIPTYQTTRVITLRASPALPIHADTGQAAKVHTTPAMRLRIVLGQS